MQQMRQVNCYELSSSFCHEECFQPPTKYGQWHVSKCRWQTVPRDRTANSEAAVTVVLRRALNR